MGMGQLSSTYRINYSTMLSLEISHFHFPFPKATPPIERPLSHHLSTATIINVVCMLFMILGVLFTLLSVPHSHSNHFILTKWVTAKSTVRRSLQFKWNAGVESWAHFRIFNKSFLRWNAEFDRDWPSISLRPWSQTSTASPESCRRLLIDGQGAVNRSRTLSSSSAATVGHRLAMVVVVGAPWECFPTPLWSRLIVS